MEKEYLFGGRGGHTDWPHFVCRTHVRWALNVSCKNRVR